MRGIVTAVACLLCAAVLAASEKPPDAYQQAMKDLSAANTALRNDVRAIEGAGAYPDYNSIEKDAAAMKAAFEKTASFWSGRGADDAVKLAQAGITHADALEAARKAKDFDALMTAAAEISKTCGGCHAAHREKTADGSYEIK